MAQHRLNMFKDEAKLDVQGNFLNAATRTMQDARMDKVRLYNEYSQGNISETDYLLAKKRIDDIPLLINSAYQTHEAKLSELTEGDPKLNFESQNQLMKAATSMNIMYDPDKRDVVLKFKDSEGKEHKTTISDYSSMVGAMQSVADQGDPIAKAMEFGTAFKADTEQQGRVTRSGMKVMGTEDRFNTAFSTAFGEKGAGDNPLVIKHMMSTVEDDTYEQAWESLRASAAAQMPEIFKRAPEPQPSQGRATPEDKAMEKIVLLTEGGMGSNPIREVKPLNGDKEPTSGIGMTFDASSTDKTLYVDGDAVEGIPREGRAAKIRVDDIFFADDGRVLIKGTTPAADPIADYLAGKEGVTVEDLLVEDKSPAALDWVQIKGSALDRIRASIMGTMSVNEMVAKLKDKAPQTESTETKKKPTAEELIAKYSN